MEATNREDLLVDFKAIISNSDTTTKDDIPSSNWGKSSVDIASPDDVTLSEDPTAHKGSFFNIFLYFFCV